MKTKVKKPDAPPPFVGRELVIPEESALYWFAAEYGPAWKQALRVAWASDCTSVPAEQAGVPVRALLLYLRDDRSGFGERGLATYAMPRGFPSRSETK